jgi:2-dehydropantoate 2-reductase
VAERLKIAVFGTGGVGGYYGSRLSHAGAEVHLIARGEHLKAFRERGLTLNSVKHGSSTLKLHATDRPEDIGACDWVLFTVKATELESAASRLTPLLKPGTGVLSLQNGVDNEEKLAKHVGAGHVVGGVVYIFSTLAGPGVVAHTGGAGRILFGEMDGAPSERTQKLLAVLRQGDVDAQIVPDIQSALWTKYVLICALSGMTTASRLPVGDLRAAPAAREMMHQILREVAQVGRACGVKLPPDIIERHASLLDETGADSRSSLYYDLTHHKPMELETLQGTVVRLGKQHGVPTPMCEAVYALLQPWALNASRATPPLPPG